MLRHDVRRICEKLSSLQGNNVTLHLSFRNWTRHTRRKQGVCVATACRAWKCSASNREKMDAESIRCSRALDRASRALPKTRSARGRGQLQKAWRGWRAPNRKAPAVPAQDGKAERTVAARKRGKAHGSARLHCLCDVRRHSGTVACARQVHRVRHCKSSGGVECSGSLCRRCRKTVRPFLQPCPCLSGQINRSGFLPVATLLAFSQRTSEKSCSLCPCATRATCLICSQRTSKTFCPRFSWATFQIVWSKKFFMCKESGKT
jgi:hypothetical protein